MLTKQKKDIENYQNYSKNWSEKYYKKFKESPTLLNETGRGRKRNILKTPLERKLVRYVYKYPRTITLVND